MVAGLALVAAACKQKEVRPEELFQTQSLGLAYLQTAQLPQAEDNRQLPPPPRPRILLDTRTSA